MKDDKLNLASFERAPAEARPPRRSAGPGPSEILFSPAEVDSVWRQVMEEAGQQSNEDFKKAFVAALRTRAMRKLFLFEGGGLELKLATGRNWTLQEWVANESADGGIVVKLKS